MLSGLVAFGCEGGAGPLRFEEVMEPAAWSMGDNATYAVVTQANWSSYYRNLPPGADFAKYVYVVASRGVKPNPGYQIKITEMTRQGNGVTVKLLVSDPEPGKFYPQVIVYPVAVVRIARADLGDGSFSFSFVDQAGKELAQVKAQL